MPESTTPDLTSTGAGREYELAMTALQRTTTVLDQLRTRASVVLSGMAIVASFLGTRTEKHGALVWVAFAILAFGMACCAGVLWPARDRRRVPESANRPSKNTLEDWWPFDRGARRFKSTITELDFKRELRHKADLASVDAAIVILVWTAHNLNQRTINRRADLFQLACLALVCEVVVLACLFAP